MLLTRLSFWIWHLFWTNFEFSNAWWNDRKRWKKEKEKIDELKTWKGGSFQKKKKKGGLSWKPERAAQSIKNLDELKTRKGDSIWKWMISLRWVEVWSDGSKRNDSGGKLKWEIWKGKLRSESEESCWHSVCLFYKARGERKPRYLQKD